MRGTYSMKPRTMGIGAGVRRLRSAWFSSVSAAALLLLGCSGAELETYDFEPEDPTAQPDVHPRTLFDKGVKTELVKSCSCHSAAQGSVMPFLTQGMEYESITQYGGGSFLTTPAVQSLLLQKGKHIGPALTSAQFGRVQGWLEAELAQRPSTGTGTGMTMKSGLLPTVAVTDGDFNMSFQAMAPINDPQANITFTLKRESGGIVRISNLKIAAGPATGIRIKHPKFYFVSARTSYPDPADSLAGVDQTIAARADSALTRGSLLLTNLPTETASTRLGLAFEVVERANPTTVDIQCKSFNLFNPAVRTELQGCAQQCHAPGRNNVAAGAFDMSMASSTDTAALKQLCVYTLGRIDKQNAAASILIKQVIPPGMGGTPNHPFKFNEATARTRFVNAVQAWAAGEK